MKATTIMSVLAAAIGLAAAEELTIEVMHSVKCDRKTQKGDQISMHYKGTLSGSGQQFDASMSAPIPHSKQCADVLSSCQGYDRGQPLKFTLGAGQVIQG